MPYPIFLSLGFTYLNMKLLDGKTAIITGASRGIGKGIAHKFAEQGANIAFTYLSSEEKAKALEAELGAIGITAKGFKSDASILILHSN